MIDLNHSQNLAVRRRTGCFHVVFLQPVLISALGLMMAGQVTAQTFTVLHSFTATDPNTRANSDGASPAGGMLTDLSGNTLYGTARSGGSSGNGTVFALNADGTGLTNLYSFTGGRDGIAPLGGLIVSGNTV